MTGVQRVLFRSRLEAERTRVTARAVSLSRRESPVLLLCLSVDALDLCNFSPPTTTLSRFILEIVLIEEIIVHYGQRFADFGAR